MDRPPDEFIPESGRITVFTTNWCGFCRRLKYQLTSREIPFVEVDIESDPSAADVVMAVNDGDRTVPTVVFPDGSTATNPTVFEVRARLDA